MRQLRVAGGPSTEDWEKMNEQHKKMLQECNDIWTKRMQDSEKEASDKIDALNSEVASLKQQIAELEAKHEKAMEEADARVKKAEQTARKATELAEQTVQSTLKGKLSVSVLAPSVRVSFSGSVPDMLVVPEAPRTKIEQVLKKEVLPGFCKVFMSESSSVGPEGQDVNVWLTGIMGGMVKAIDDHVTGVLRQANDSNTVASDGSVTEVRTSSAGRRPDSAGRNSMAQAPLGPPPGSGRRMSTGQARMQSVARRSMSQNPATRPR
ncbi:hypothetical protein CYMTET_27942 [Cymbomonas tetramitiformis]|uniref:Uncharacterized protein n=1 Tax=Cymbomonas tetramitiformis TaxID=36881 RepID=A0AAE0FNY4_9CHLO|nr:hypothetical protein CYMTET_27942 [Cymbomonas tetramitiformis]